MDSDLTSRIKDGALGVILGLILTVAVGFLLAGWKTESGATRLANDRATAAVVSSMATICAARFRGEGTETLQSDFADLDPQRRSGFLEGHGFATMPGAATARAGAAHFCAEILGAN